MKLFRQKDELFELMSKQAARSGPEATDGTGTGARRARSTPTTRPLARPTQTAVGGTAGSTVGGTAGGTVGSTIGGTVGGTVGSTRGTVGSTIGGTVGGTIAGAGAGAGSTGPSKRATTTKGARPFGPIDSGSFASPLGGPPLQRPLGELIEIEGDALVVLDDDWEAAAPPSEPIGRLLALRLDTAVVGGLLVVGLLATAFLVGRTSSDDATKPPTIAQAPLEAGLPDALIPTHLPANSIGGGTTAPAGFRPAGQTPAPPPPAAAPATPAVTERSVTKGAYEICVVSTKADKATAVAKWLNENPRSPIFGRTDLEATARGGSVKIVGFAKQESDVLTRVRATSDPTGGSGTFHDAFCRPVR